MAWSPHLTEFRAVVSISNRLSSGPKMWAREIGSGPEKNHCFETRQYWKKPVFWVQPS